jgi:hypothetical protein
MRGIERISIAALAAAIVVFGIALPVQAQQRYPIVSNAKGQTSKYTQQYKMDVGDVPGHQIRIQETHRIYNEASTLRFSDVKVKESWIRGYSDYTNGKGKAWGYGQWVLEDGNKVFFEYVGTSHSETTASGSLKGSYHGATRIVGGTGKYKGIRGGTTDVVNFDNDPKTGYNNSDGAGEYWFED